MWVLIPSMNFTQRSKYDWTRSIVVAAMATRRRMQKCKLLQTPLIINRTIWSRSIISVPWKWYNPSVYSTIIAVAKLLLEFSNSKSTIDRMVVKNFERKIRHIIWTIRLNSKDVIHQRIYVPHKMDVINSYFHAKIFPVSAIFFLCCVTHGLGMFDICSVTSIF